MSAIDHIRRDLSPDKPDELIVNGIFKGDNAVVEQTDDPYHLGNETQTTTDIGGVEYIGFSEYYIPYSQNSTGRLAIADSLHKAVPLSNGETVSLVKYKNDSYGVVNDSVRLDKDAADALNAMMSDYNEETQLDDFVVYGTTETYTGEGSYCPEYFPDSPTGYTIDLALISNGTVMTYDGQDDESWIVENCWKYGYVVRSPHGKSDRTGHGYCPWHLRYVGDIHAAVMYEKGYCLEEYVDFLKKYTFDAPFTYNLGEKNYEIYTVESTGDMTSARVPITGNFSVSGTYRDSYIITTVK